MNLRKLVSYRTLHDIAKRETTGQVFVKSGPGGRSSVSGGLVGSFDSLGHTATVFGCTGFLGRYVVNNLGIFFQRF